MRKYSEAFWKLVGHRSDSVELTRYVRTAEGAREYGKPIGSPISGGGGGGDHGKDWWGQSSKREPEKKDWFGKAEDRAKAEKSKSREGHEKAFAEADKKNKEKHAARHGIKWHDESKKSGLFGKKRKSFSGRSANGDQIEVSELKDGTWSWHVRAAGSGQTPKAGASKSAEAAREAVNDALDAFEKARKKKD